MRLSSTPKTERIGLKRRDDCDTLLVFILHFQPLFLIQSHCFLGAAEKLRLPLVIQHVSFSLGLVYSNVLSGFSYLKCHTDLLIMV